MEISSLIGFPNTRGVRWSVFSGAKSMWLIEFFSGIWLFIMPPMLFSNLYSVYMQNALLGHPMPTIKNDYHYRPPWLEHCVPYWLMKSPWFQSALKKAKAFRRKERLFGVHVIYDWRNLTNISLSESLSSLKMSNGIATSGPRQNTL